MLRHLRIRHLALVDDLVWEPAPGFLVITGETGAGKSIILGALALVLGDRADRTLIRAGAESCGVEAEWDITALPAAPDIARVLDESGAEPCDDGVLRLKRTLTAAGQNRQFINGSPVPLAVLKRLGDLLADFHGPHDHQSLLSSDTQRELLDSFGGHAARLDAVRAAHASWREAAAAHDQLARESQATEAEIELLRHQSDEIGSAGLQPGEDDAVKAQLDAATHGVRLLELARQLDSILSQGEANAGDLLASADRTLGEMSGLDPRADAMRAHLGAAQDALAELNRDLAGYASRIELDEDRLGSLNARFDVITSLKRRYGPTLDDVLARLASARERLGRLERRDSDLAASAAHAEAARNTLHAECATLTQARRDTAVRLGKSITTELRNLGFPKASFSASVGALTEPAAHGADSIEFLFAPNPGEGSKPLRAIASSGEMARVMLAIKTTLAEQDRVPFLVFDEVDANVGGEIGARVGRLLHQLGASHQVVCITHLPQVAALGVSHFSVTKEECDGRTVSRMRLLDPGERVAELARMLGGDTPAARDLAASMIASAPA